MPTDEFALMSGLDFGSDASTLTDGRERGLQEIRATPPDPDPVEKPKPRSEMKRPGKRGRPLEESAITDPKRAITVTIPMSIYLALVERMGKMRRAQETALARGEKVPGVSFSSVLTETLKKGLSA